MMLGVSLRYKILILILVGFGRGSVSNESRVNLSRKLNQMKTAANEGEFS